MVQVSISHLRFNHFINLFCLTLGQRNEPVVFESVWVQEVLIELDEFALGKITQAGAEDTSTSH